MAVSCDGLTQLSNFASYIKKLDNATNKNLALAVQCKTQICPTIWGSGNPDISGIGVREMALCKV